MARLILIMLLVVASGLSSAESSPLTVEQFQKLPNEEQVRLVEAAFGSLVVTLAWVRVEESSDMPAGKTLSACLKDRSTGWVVGSVREYLTRIDFTPTSFSGAVVQAMAWKCGLFRF